MLLEKLGDLYAAQGKPSSSAYMFQQALKASPTPQQRVRLSLALADKLSALDRTPEAYAILQDFLKESPDYADKPAVYRRLVALATKLSKVDEAARYQAELNTLSPGSSPTNSPKH